MSKRETVERGSGLGYHASRDIYEDNEKVCTEVERTTLDGKEYIDVLDPDGKTIDTKWK